LVRVLGVFGLRSAEDLGVAFVVAFIVCLVSAAAFLALGRKDLADQLATVAYYFLVAYFLVAGIASMLFSLVRGGRGGGSGGS